MIMKWQDIKTSPDNTHFLFDGKSLYGKKFIEVLKFHAPGLAPVKDEHGAYHINTLGESVYSERYDRTFGYYCGMAAVIAGADWFHIDETEKRIYPQSYAWCGNYQENICTVRNFDNKYNHIDMNGKTIYAEKYLYCGDFKDGFACVKLENGFFKHIDRDGNFINDKEFVELGVFHKNYATARDADGWFHIDIYGNPIYKRRFAAVEPFYNGQAKVEPIGSGFEIVGEDGTTVLRGV